MAKRKRRSFTKEFKAQAVRIVRESRKAVGTVARELDLTETALRSWVRAGGDRRGARGARGAHDRRAGGAGASAARDPDVAHGARHLKKLSGTARAVPPAGPETRRVATMMCTREPWPSA